MSNVWTNAIYVVCVFLWVWHAEYPFYCTEQRNWLGRSNSPKTPSTVRNVQLIIIQRRATPKKLSKAIKYIARLSTNIFCVRRNLVDVLPTPTIDFHWKTQSSHNNKKLTTRRNADWKEVRRDLSTSFDIPSNLTHNYFSNPIECYQHEIGFVNIDETGRP